MHENKSQHNIPIIAVQQIPTKKIAIFYNSAFIHVLQANHKIYMITFTMSSEQWYVFVKCNEKYKILPVPVNT